MKTCTRLCLARLIAFFILAILLVAFVYAMLTDFSYTVVGNVLIIVLLMNVSSLEIEMNQVLEELNND